MENTIKPKLNMLVESFAFGFGRIVGIYEFAGFNVRFSNGTVLTYCFDELGTVLKVHEEN